MDLVLGAGLSGLGAARTSGATVLERASGPGGICRSYHVRPGTTEPLDHAPADGEAYRFEIGGGHWLFGGDPAVLDLIGSLTPLRHYERRAAVHLRDPDRLVPYPLQQHLDDLGPLVAERARAELAGRSDHPATGVSMQDWLRAEFGPTLFDVFFGPFHERYTAGLHREIEPQDAYKTPTAPSPGYNRTFAYPTPGLDELTRRLAAGHDVRYGQEVVAIDTSRRTVRLADGGELVYGSLLSTLPLDVTLRLAGLDAGGPPDPHSSVLVLNIGARRGRRCPDVHWLYEPASDAGFHRIGFYSHVDEHFLPRSRRGSGVSLYVERAYRSGRRPAAAEVERYQRLVIAELQSRGYIGQVDVVDPSWVDAAYTWRAVGSDWRTRAIDVLVDHGIEPVGRYARWHFQGMAESLADGIAAGTGVRAQA